MTAVALNLTQATLDTLAAARAGAQASGPATLAAQFSQVIKAGYNFAANHYYYDSIALDAPAGWMTFADSAYQYFTGMTMKGAATDAAGTFSATALENYVPSAYALLYQGTLNYSYTNSATTGLVLNNLGGAISNITLRSNLMPWDAQYDATFGNVSSTVSGALASSDSNQFTGKVTSIETTADSFLVSSKVTGTLDVAGSATDIGLGVSAVRMGGTVTAVVEQYADGSSFTLDSPLQVTGAEVLDDRMLSDSSYFTGNDTISVTLPATLSSAYAVHGGDGNDRITITGGGGNLSADGGNGNDTILLGDHGHTVVGGDGMDTAIFSGMRSMHTVSANVTPDGESTVSAAGRTDTLTGVERMQFDDAYMALDIAGSAGNTYRLYQAAFDRTPDKPGLGYWIYQMDKGMSVLQMAENFTHSAEFQSIYGVNPTNAVLVNNFYHNTLHRDAEPAGFAYWLNVLDNKLATTAAVLAMFSEGAENQATVLKVIGSGIEYTPYTP